MVSGRPACPLNKMAPHALRVVGIATIAGLGSAVSGMTALCARSLTLPPSDGAYGKLPWALLGDPFVRDVWLLLVGLGAAVNASCGVPLLWRVHLRLAAPYIILLPAAASFIGGTMSVPLALHASLFASLGVMSWSRGKTAWRLL